ncbi:hypothetical protein FRC06_011391 [Ceratobasidium sp. 370]|nr:hypothetical protein FRC06_011391 [Ceratobasidium sp. 370]
MATPPPSHGQNAVPVQLSPDPDFCIKSRALPDGHKLFVNICHDSAIPSADGHVPVVLTGQPCIIFDAIFNPDLCAKAGKDAELRRTLIEISLVRVEQATGFKLSRTIATPNIKSKGPIPPRTARIPAFWASRPSLVQEIDGPTTPTWTWSPTRDGCRIVINVPDLTKPLHKASTLDIEARRLILTVGSRYHLDTPLLPPAGSKPAPDAKVSSNSNEDMFKGTYLMRAVFKPVGGTKFLPTTVDPDSAVAEWSVRDKEIVVAIKWASVAAREREKGKENAV